MIPTARQLRNLIITRERAWRKYLKAFGEAETATVRALEPIGGVLIVDEAYHQFVIWLKENPQ